MSKTNLCFYKYAVKFTEEYENNEFKTEVRPGVVCAKNFRDAMYKISDYYGDENIEDVRIEFMEDIDILEIDEIMGYFEKKIDSIDDPVIEKDGVI
jgi:hypothetical protein